MHAFRLLFTGLTYQNETFTSCRANPPIGPAYKSFYISPFLTIVIANDLLLFTGFISLCLIVSSQTGDITGSDKIAAVLLQNYL